MADTDVPDRFWPAVRLVINNLWWILLLAAVEQAGEGHGQTAIVFGFLFLIDIAIAAKWGFLAGAANTGRGRRALGLAMVVAGILLVAVGTYLLASAPAANLVPSEAPPQGATRRAAPVNEFVKNQGVGMTFTQNPGAQAAVAYHAQFAYTGSHLRAFVEYTSLGAAPGSVSNRVQVGEFSNFIRNDPLAIPIVSRTDTADRRYQFWWGNSNSGLRFDIEKYQARLVLLQDDGKEQHYYFTIIPGVINGIIYPDAVPADKLSFAAQWDAHDAQR